MTPVRTPTFLGGLHRSGTTPLARTLAAHPDVSGFAGTGVPEDEGQHLQGVYRPATAHGGPGWFARTPASHLTELDVADDATATRDASRLWEDWSRHWDLQRRVLLEKSPPNLVMTRYLQRLFPGARFVVIVRHPVVVALSTKKWTPTASVGDLLENWCAAHETFAADAAHVEHLLVVRYEELLADPRLTLDRVGSFLGLGSPVAADGWDVARSERYRSRWEERQASRRPRRWWEQRGLVRRFEPRVNAFGYSLEDLGRVGPWPTTGP